MEWAPTFAAESHPAEPSSCVLPNVVDLGDHTVQTVHVVRDNRFLGPQPVVRSGYEAGGPGGGRRTTRTVPKGTCAAVLGEFGGRFWDGFGELAGHVQGSVQHFVCSPLQAACTLHLPNSKSLPNGLPNTRLPKSQLQKTNVQSSVPFTAKKIRRIRHTHSLVEFANPFELSPFKFSPFLSPSSAFGARDGVPVQLAGDTRP